MLLYGSAFETPSARIDFGMLPMPKYDERRKTMSHICAPESAVLSQYSHGIISAVTHLLIIRQIYDRRFHQ